VVGKERSHLDSYYIRGDRKKEERRRRRRSSWNNKNIKGELELGEEVVASSMQGC
jgi:hypothetical protein